MAVDKIMLLLPLVQVAQLSVTGKKHEYTKYLLTAEKTGQEPNDHHDMTGKLMKATSNHN